MSRLEEALKLLREAKPFVGRCASIAAQDLSKQITEFLAKQGEKK